MKDRSQELLIFLKYSVIKQRNECVFDDKHFRINRTGRTASKSLKMGLGFHGCPPNHSQEYCVGYENGYNDEGKLLG